MHELCKLLDLGISCNSSDIHFTTEDRDTVALRVKGDIEKHSEIKITRQDVVQFFNQYRDELSEEVIKLCEEGINAVDGDFSYGDRRFRFNLSKSTKGVTGVIRMLGETILRLSDLGVPESLSSFTKFNEGLILVVGATGSGKSTTLAAMVDSINETESVHIVTIEHPVEYKYTNKRALVTQKSVGEHCFSFKDAVVAAMRQDPDILLIGEMRDHETISAACTMAETGHLVLGTLHSNSTVEAITRMVDVFPDESKNMIKTQISNVLRAVVSQQLIKSSLTNKYVPLCEVLVLDDKSRAMIREGKSITQIRESLRNEDYIKRGAVHIVDNAASHVISGRLAFSDLLGRLIKSDLELLVKVLRTHDIVVEVPAEFL